MPQRIHTIGGSGGASTSTAVVTAATVQVGPDYGTTNQKVELHLSPGQEQVNYPLVEEQSLRSTTFTQAYSPMTEELHVGSVEKQAYSPMTEELHLSQISETQQYLLTEELSLRPTSLTQSYLLTEELHVAEFQTQTYPFVKEELHIGSVENPVYRMTEELKIPGHLQQTVFVKAKEELHISGTISGPPQFESFVKTTVANSSVLAFTGASTIVGRFLLAAVAGSDGTPTWTAPAGWTQILQTTNGAAGNSMALGSFWHVVGAGDPSSWTFTHTNAATESGVVAAYSGVDTTTPVGASTASTGNNATITVPTLTVPTSNSLLVALSGVVGTSGAAFTSAAAYVDQASAVGSQLTTAVSSDMQTHVQSATGASGTKTIGTGLTLAPAWVAQHVALNPAVRVIA